MVWLGCVLCLYGVAWPCAQGQVARSSTRILGTTSTDGYFVVLPYSTKVIERTWWQFLKNLGKVRLKKNYWELYPTEEVVLYTAVTHGRKSGCQLYLGVNSDASTKKGVKSKLQAVRELVEGFVVVILKKDLAEQLKKNERKKRKKSVRLERFRVRQRRLETHHVPSQERLVKIENLQLDMEELEQERASIIHRLSTLAE